MEEVKMTVCKKEHNSVVSTGIDVLSAWIDRQVRKQYHIDKDIIAYSRVQNDINKARVLVAERDKKMSEGFCNQVKKCIEILESQKQQ